jgi:hypothetical protein
VTRDLSFAGNYGAVLYELTLLVLVGLPSSWNIRQLRAGIRRDAPTVQESFEAVVNTVFKELIPLYFKARRIGLDDWNHLLFSIIGMATTVYADTQRESAKELATELITTYRDLVVADDRNNEDALDYLQLASVWARHLLQDTALADSLVNIVANKRPFHAGFYISGKTGWGMYGYPHVSIARGDFFISYPRNIGPVLTKATHKTVNRWTEMLMNPDQLKDTYKTIEKIREPITRQIQQRRRMNQQRNENE